MNPSERDRHQGNDRASTRRTKVPKATESVVLLQSRRRCCLCCFLANDFSTKRGQIAHIDRNCNNNLFDNLVFLCLTHHDEYDTVPSQSKGFTAFELKDYRERLYLQNSQEERKPKERTSAPRDIIPFPTFHTRTGHKSTVINAGGDVNFSPRITKKNIVQPGPDHLMPDEAKQVRDQVIGLAELEAQSGRKLNIGKWYNRLYAAFGVTSYHLLPANSLDQVISWIQQQAAMIRPRLRRTNNQAWRNSLYSGIWARSCQVGLTKEDVYALAQTVLELKNPPVSLKELGERQLKKLHDRLFSKTRA